MTTTAITRYIVRGTLAALSSALALVSARRAEAQGIFGEADRADRPPPAFEERERAPLVRGNVGARTDAPLFVGAQAYVEHGPTRLRLTGAAGVLPSGYAQWVNGALSGPAYDERLGRALEDTLSSGFAWNAHVGWRPLARRGLLVELGYGTTRLAAEGDARPIVARETGVDVPVSEGVDTSFALATTLHMIDARVGWEWVLARHVTVHASVGLTRIVGASTALEQRYLADAPALAQQSVAQQSDELDSSFRRYGYVPTVGLAVGYRF